MADSTTHITQIEASQAQKEVTANGLFDAASPAMAYGRRAEACSGLTWGYYGTRYGGAVVANGTNALATGTTTYMVMAVADGAVSFSTATTNWDDSANYGRCYKIVTGGSTVTSYEDHRFGPLGPIAAAVLAGVVDVDQPFDAAAFHPGIPTGAAVVLRIPLARAVAFPSNFSGSYGKASAASTGTATFDVQKNGVSCGSVVFTSSATATFSTSGSVSFAAGDVLSIIAPGSPDGTLADIGITLAGTR